ncbi:FTR1 family protein [Thiolapillus brandeum]|nr:cytochrome c/FTR1 family iron permease [Thiolapillus brandeum]
MRALLLSLLIGFVTPVAVQANEPLQKVQQLVDYVGVDYHDAVSGGRILNATEYDEMLDFSGTLVDLSRELPNAPQVLAIQNKLTALDKLIQARGEAQEVSSLAGEIRQLLIQAYGLTVVPHKLPDLARGKALYSEQCTSCHGLEGQGNGVLAGTLNPSPTDFTDYDRYSERTVYGLYNTITHGVEGTAMQSYAALPDADRWALAFYVGQLAASAKYGEAAPDIEALDPQKIGAHGLTTMTPAEVTSKFGDKGAQLMAWLRSHPETVIGVEDSSGLAFARDTLQQSLAAYKTGDHKAAHDLAVTAYLEGFELMEGSLDAVDGDLRRRIEGGMTAYRGLIKKNAPYTELSNQVEHLNTLLTSAENKLASHSLSPATAYTSALVILLREGLEAILVIAALAAFLIKTGRRDGLRYLYLGTGAAFFLGLLTWYVSSNVITIGGAGRELTEGFAALFAAVMLFYVGFWLHSKTGAAQWKAFIHGSIEKALSKGTLWGLSGLAFIAVYREIFETVLFYQALWIQTGKAGQGMIFTGFLTAAGALLLIGWLILRYSTRLPLRQFFSVSGVFMFVLAIIFAGKGIAALQEAGKLPVSIVNFPSVEVLGIYPNLQGLGVQLTLVLVAVLLLWKGSKTSSGKQTRSSQA